MAPAMALSTASKPGSARSMTSAPRSVGCSYARGLMPGKRIRLLPVNTTFEPIDRPHPAPVAPPEQHNATFHSTPATTPAAGYNAR